MIGSKVAAILMRFYMRNFNILLLPFTKVEGPINQLQNKSLGKSYDRMLVSEFAILSEKRLKIAAQKKLDFWVFVNLCWWV